MGLVFFLSQESCTSFLVQWEDDDTNADADREISQNKREGNV